MTHTATLGTTSRHNLKYRHKVYNTKKQLNNDIIKIHTQSPKSKAEIQRNLQQKSPPKPHISSFRETLLEKISVTFVLQAFGEGPFSKILPMLQKKTLNIIIK